MSSERALCAGACEFNGWRRLFYRRIQTNPGVAIDPNEPERGGIRTNPTPADCQTNPSAVALRNEPGAVGSNRTQGSVAKGRPRSAGGAIQMNPSAADGAG